MHGSMSVIVCCGLKVVAGHTEILASRVFGADRADRADLRRVLLECR